MVDKYEYPSRVATDKQGTSKSGRFVQTVITSGQWTLTRQGRIWRPPTDVYETDSSIVIKVEVAGMAEDDFSITFADQSLVITGVRRDPAAKLGYHQMEILYGEFRTDVHLTVPITTDNIKAEYEAGFLVVTLPKTQPQRVTINGE
jgi:HSP20 family molecular chaperone IbpA